MLYLLNRKFLDITIFIGSKYGTSSLFSKRAEGVNTSELLNLKEKSSFLQLLRPIRIHKPKNGRHTRG